MSATAATATVRGRLAAYPRFSILPAGGSVANLLLDLDDRHRSRFSASVFEPRALDAIRDARPGALVEVHGQLEMTTLPATETRPARAIAHIRVFAAAHHATLIEQESAR